MRYLLTALTVVLAMTVVGIMLISALLILPAATALQLAKGFRTAIVSVALGVCTVVALLHNEPANRRHHRADQLPHLRLRLRSPQRPAPQLNPKAFF